jgi:prolyl 4-hydroxylase
MPDFIYQAYLNDLNLCDNLISYYQECPSKHTGDIMRSGKSHIDVDIKDSVDVRLYGEEGISTAYVDSLQVLVKEYINKFEYCNTTSPWTITEPINIQHYMPGGGYKQWHAERGSGYSKDAARHLVFMTYLNDVDDAGETEFFYQKIKVKPRKGLTLLWPADWTYTHRGVPSPTQEKYIVTGWFSYTE